MRREPSGAGSTPRAAPFRLNGEPIGQDPLAFEPGRGNAELQEDLLGGSAPVLQEREQLPAIVGRQRPGMGAASGEENEERETGRSARRTVPG